nr:immunoglobulin heavy chain junction region [Macaca mulatta]
CAKDSQINGRGYGLDSW